MVQKVKGVKKHPKKGFTFIELIVVLAIILILSAVLVPNVIRYASQAGLAGTKQDAASMLTQLQADVAWAEVEGKAVGAITDADVQTSVPYTSGEITGAGETAYTFALDKDSTSATYGEVVSFGYRDSRHYLTWTMEEGWKVDGEE